MFRRSFFVHFHLAIVSSVLQFTASDYPFAICWPLYHLSFNLQLLITPLLYVGHCIICASIYGFWLPLCYMLAIVPPVLQFTASDYPFAICWPLYHLSFNLRLLITPLLYAGHCTICPSIYGFWLPLCYMLAIVSSVLQFTASDYPFAICWLLYRLSFDLRFWLPLCYMLAIVSSPTSIYAFWLPHWYLLAIVSSVLLWFMPSDYPFAICWPLYHLCFNLRLLITPLLYVGHCTTCPSIYASDYPFAICWPLYHLSFNLRLLITPLLYAGHCTICPSIYGFWLPLCYMFAIVSSVLQFTAFDYPFAICWPLYHLSFNLRLLITPWLYVGHYIICPSIYGFWLSLCYMLAIISSVLRFTASDYPFAICWPLYHLSFDLWVLITPLLYVGHCIVCPSIYGFWLPLCYMLAIVSSPTSIYAFWLPHWYLLAIVSSVLLWFMPSDYPFGIFWPLYRLSYFDLCLLITPLSSFGHCIVCPTLIYAFWLPLWYLLAIVSSVLRFTASDYPFAIGWPLYRLLLRSMPSDYHIGIYWPLYRLSYFDLCLLITPLVSFGHCIVCPTLIYAFWLPLWYLLAIVSSVLLWFMPSDYPFVIFWPVYRLSYFDLCLLITPLFSFGQCIVCPTLINSFWLHLCFLLASVSSVLLWIMPSHYHFGIFCPLYHLSYFNVCLLITPLVSFGHCIVCLTLMYAFWLPLSYMLAIVSSVLLR